MLIWLWAGLCAALPPVDLLQRTLILTGPVLREEWFIVLSQATASLPLEMDPAEAELVSHWQARMTFPREQDLLLKKQAGHKWQVEMPADIERATLVITWAFHGRVKSDDEAGNLQNQKLVIGAQPLPMAAKKGTVHLIVPQTTKLSALFCAGGGDQSGQQPTTNAKEPSLPKGVNRYSCPTLGSLWAKLELANRTPMIRVKRLHRTLMHCPWTGLLQITDDYEWLHDGHPVNDFNRAEYLRLLMQPNLSKTSQAMNILPVLLPAKAQLTRLYDELGLLLNQQLNQRTVGAVQVLDVQPRFPLVSGGWSTRFLLDYQLAELPSQQPLFNFVLDLPMDELVIDLAPDSLPIAMTLTKTLPNCALADGRLVCQHLTIEHAQMAGLSLGYEPSARAKALLLKFGRLLTALLFLMASWRLLHWLITDPRLIKRNTFIKLTQRRRRLLAKKDFPQLKAVEAALLGMFKGKPSASPSLQAINLRKVYDEQNSLMMGGEVAAEVEELAAMQARVEQTELRLQSLL